MDRELTLGSLFSGSGGFELGGLLCGIRPVFASEVEPFPIRVTTKRLPDVKHVGDINRIDGAKVTPVDIITAGFCCQDLSVAGKRAGLHGERSGLFFQITRIIAEMLAATNNEYPRFAVLENVPGIYSSNGGLDFQEVLNALIRIKDETLSVPLPEKRTDGSSGGWSTAGEIVGDGFSVGWRTLDAQFWGVAQRRRRCFIVVDFAGERAGEILFDETRLRGHPPPSGFPWQATAGNTAAGPGNAVAFEPGACSRLGGHVWDNRTGALRADAGDNQTAVIYDARGNGSGETACTITGDHNGHISDYTALAVKPKPAAFMGGQGANARSIAYSEEVAPTIRGEAGGNSVPMVMTAFGIGAYNSNGMKSPNPRSGIYEASTSRTLDTSIPDPNKNAGGMAVVFDGKQVTSKHNRSNPRPGGPCHTLPSCGADSAIVCLEGNGARPSHNGSGVSESGVAFSLNTIEQHGVAYAMTTGCYTQVSEEQAPTLQARDYKDAPVVNESQYIVRRLTPTECALLQGFPSDWCAGLETPEPTEEDIAFWSEVWETHRIIAGTYSKSKTRAQIVKWLKAPYSDAAAYKMWGNGVALPCVVFVLAGIAFYAQK